MVKRMLGWMKRVIAQADGPAASPHGTIFARTSRWTDRLADVTLIRLVLWVAIAAWVHQGIYSDPFKLAEWMDDHAFHAMEEGDRMTLLRWGQIPAWNPYWCGGTVGVSGPEDPFFGPDFLLRIAFGVAHGRRLAILLLVVMGFEGMYRVCRRLDATVIASGFAAVVFGTCDRYVSFIHDGWINFLGCELIPWVCLCFLKGLDSWRYRLLGGFFFAWIVLSAGTYTTPFTLLMLAYVTAAFSVRALVAARPSGTTSATPRAWLTPWVVSGTIGVVALGLAFGKLVPTFAFLRQFPRVFTPVEVHALGEVIAPFTIKYGIVLLLALVALLTADAAAALFFGGAMFFGALAMGDFGTYSPFHILKSLPIFSQLRFPDRYIVLVLFFTAICAARGITRFEDAVPALARRLWIAARGGWRRLRKKAEDGLAPATAPEVPREVLWLAVGLATWFSYSLVRPQAEAILEKVRITPTQMYVEEPPRTYDQPFKQHRGNRRDEHIFPAANMGSLYCVAGNPLPESPLLRGDLEQEEYPLDPTKATVKRLSWSPNEIELEVDAKEPTSVYVNQNWAAEWRSNVGTVKSVEQLLTVDVPAGKYTLVLAYRDRRLMACLLVSLLTFLALLFVFLREGFRWAKEESKRWRTIPMWPDQLPADAVEGAADAVAEPAAEPDETSPGGTVPPPSNARQQ